MRGCLPRLNNGRSTSPGAMLGNVVSTPERRLGTPGVMAVATYRLVCAFALGGFWDIWPAHRSPAV